MKSFDQENQSTNISKLAIAAIIATAVGAVAVVGGVNGLKASTSLTPAAMTEKMPVPAVQVSIADIVERVGPAVVTIEVIQSAGSRAAPDVPPQFEEFFRRFFDEDGARRFGERFGAPGRPAPRGPQARGLGSGFIIGKDGLIVTNNHVIEGAGEITVALTDGRKLNARLIGADDKTDLALLKVDAKEDLPVVEFGDSRNMRVGDTVVAIGNPFGVGQTVTTGIISAHHRDIGSGPFDDFIQIDAPINRGNSGGPAFNLKGEVIGVNTAIFSPSGGNVGIGFAIPSNLARRIIDDLADDGNVERGWLGVHIQAVSPELAKGLDLKEAEGALVAQVADGSPADKFGIRQGDVILDVNNQDVKALRDVPRMIADIKAGDVAQIKVWRGGREKILNVRIGTQPAENVAAAPDIRADVAGMRLGSLTPALRERLGVENAEGGVVITGIERGSAAARQGLDQGDVILAIGGKPVSSVSDASRFIAEAKENDRQAVLILIKRRGIERFVALPLRGA